MSIVSPEKHGIWPRARAITARFVAAQRAQIALWERVYAWPVDDGQLRWIDTINGPALRGRYVPEAQNVMR